MDQFDPEEAGQDLGDATQCFNCGIGLSTKWLHWDDEAQRWVLTCPECGAHRVVEV